MRNKNYPLYEVSRPSSISDMLRTRAEKQPDTAAFRYRKGRDEIETKTYAEVLGEVKKTASWVEQTYGRGSHIAIIGENSYEWIIAFFAILTS